MRRFFLTNQGGSLPVLRPVVRRSVAVAVASPQLASLVHLAEGIAHHQPHIKHHKEESSQIIGCLDNRHHLLPFIAWPGLHSMGPPMGPQCFEFSLFSSIEVLICRPIFHWSPLSWQQAPEIGFLHSFSSNCATCTFTFQQGTRVGGPPRAKARVGQVIAVQFRWTIEHQSLSEHLMVVHFTQCRNSTVLYILGT